MERLYGTTILIGKEPGHGRLLISTTVNGQPKTSVLGEIGSVPNSVSRCLPTQGAAHCKITVDKDGAMTLTNLKPQNATYVNGAEIVSKHITTDSNVALGKDLYSLDVKAVVEAAKQLLPEKPKEYSLLPLKGVWENYNNQLKAMRIRQRNIGLLSSMPIMFSMIGGLIAGVMPEIREYALVFTGIAVVIMVYGFYKRFTDKSIEEQEQLTEQFQNQYICPNPKCRHFMGNQPYNILRQHTNCPYCKCKFNEK